MMGFLDALTADAYPQDSMGRRVFAPYGLRGKAYILPPERAALLARMYRRGFKLYVAALLLAGWVLGPWSVVVVGLLGVAGVFGANAYAVRGLEVSREHPPALPREERVARAMLAMGRPTMLALCLGGAAFAVAGASLLLRGQRSVAVWFLTFYGALVSLLYARKLSNLSGMPPAT
jgi:hypothetical protein